MKIYKKVVQVENRDVWIIILAIISLGFINLHLALLVGCIYTLILVMTKTIDRLNPIHNNGNQIISGGEKLFVPNRVKIFELIDASSKDKLYKYVHVFKGMVIPPRILIIRFQESFEISHRSIVVLHKVEKTLSKEKIELIFSDVDLPIKNLLIKMDLLKNIAENNICKNINDALTRAEEILEIN